MVSGAAAHKTCLGERREDREAAKEELGQGSSLTLNLNPVCAGGSEHYQLPEHNLASSFLNSDSGCLPSVCDLHQGKAGRGQRNLLQEDGH